MTDPVSKVWKVVPLVCNCPASSEYCSNFATAPDLASALRVAAGKCFTNVPGVLLKNISISAWRAVCGGAEVSEGEAHTATAASAEKATSLTRYFTVTLLAIP